MKKLLTRKSLSRYVALCLLAILGLTNAKAAVGDEIFKFSFGDYTEFPTDYLSAFKSDGTEQTSDLNGTNYPQGGSWTFITTSKVYLYGGAAQTPGWLIMKNGYDLKANYTYTFTLAKAQNVGGYSSTQCKLTPYIGTSCSVAGMTEAQESVSMESANKAVTFDFTPTADGTYYLGFKAETSYNDEYVALYRYGNSISCVVKAEAADEPGEAGDLLYKQVGTPHAGTPAYLYYSSYTLPIPTNSFAGAGLTIYHKDALGLDEGSIIKELSFTGYTSYAGKWTKLQVYLANADANTTDLSNIATVGSCDTNLDNFTLFYEVGSDALSLAQTGSPTESVAELLKFTSSEGFKYTGGDLVLYMYGVNDTGYSFMSIAAASENDTLYSNNGSLYRGTSEASMNNPEYGAWKSAYAYTSAPQKVPAVKVGYEEPVLPGPGEAGYLSVYTGNGYFKGSINAPTTDSEGNDYDTQTDFFDKYEIIAVNVESNEEIVALCQEEEYDYYGSMMKLKAGCYIPFQTNVLPEGTYKLKVVFYKDGVRGLEKYFVKGYYDTDPGEWFIKVYDLVPAHPDINGYDYKDKTVTLEVVPNKYGYYTPEGYSYATSEELPKDTKGTIKIYLGTETERGETPIWTKDDVALYDYTYSNPLMAEFNVPDYGKYYVWTEEIVNGVASKYPYTYETEKCVISFWVRDPEIPASPQVFVINQITNTDDKVFIEAETPYCDEDYKSYTEDKEFTKIQITRQAYDENGELVDEPKVVIEMTEDADGKKFKASTKYNFTDTKVKAGKYRYAAYVYDLDSKSLDSESTWNTNLKDIEVEGYDPCRVWHYNFTKLDQYDYDNFSTKGFTVYDNGEEVTENWVYSGWMNRDTQYWNENENNYNNKVFPMNTHVAYLNGSDSYTPWDDYLISPALDLKAGREYIFTVNYAALAAYEFELTVGNDKTPAAQTAIGEKISKNTDYDDQGIRADLKLETATRTFTPETDGIYYVSVHGTAQTCLKDELNQSYPSKGLEVSYMSVTYDATIPNPVEDLKGEAVGTYRKGTKLTYKLPTTDTKGNPITVDKVTMVMEDADGNELENLEYTENLSEGVITYMPETRPESAEYTYTVYAWLEDVPSAPASVKVYNGYRQIAQPENVKAEYVKNGDNYDVTIYWNTNFKDTDGNDLDCDGLYHYFAKINENEEATQEEDYSYLETTETSGSYTFKGVTEDELKNKFAVRPYWRVAAEETPWFAVQAVEQDMSAPYDLTGTVDGRTVTLTWKAPGTQEQADAQAPANVNGYYVYRDGEQINEEMVTETTYVDKDVPLGKHVWFVRAVYDTHLSGNSNEFTTDLTGINGVNAEGVAITAEGLELVVRAEAPATVQVVTADGKVVYQGIVEGEVRVPVANGLYIARANNLTLTILVK